jgi:hypothetical protein
VFTRVGHDVRMELVLLGAGAVGLTAALWVADRAVGTDRARLRAITAAQVVAALTVASPRPRLVEPVVPDPGGESPRRRRPRPSDSPRAAA